MSANPLADYYAALDRLKKRNAKINNDTVAVEAGRMKGTIKKSRALYAELIQAINNTAAEQAIKPNQDKTRANKYRNEAIQLRGQLDAAYAREVSLLAELLEAKRTIQALSGKSVFPLRGRNSGKKKKPLDYQVDG